MIGLAKFIKRDIEVQQALIAITIGSIILLPLIGIAFCLLGAWQLFSAIYIWRKIKDEKRRNYLVYCFFHLSLMAVYIFSDYSIKENLNQLFGNDFNFLVTIFMIIPIILAIWYLKYSHQTLNLLTEGKHEFFTEKEKEEVLDSGEMFP